MNEFFDANLARIITTAVVIILYFVVRYALKRIMTRYSQRTSVSRTSMALIKRTLIFILAITAIIIIATVWGVRPQNIFLTLSSIFAVIGVALFAQWSLLSNITAGFVLLFSLQLRIGDTIKILDKDFPVIAEVEDIRTFYIYLRGEDKERYVYPNNILLQKGISILYHRSKQNETTDI